MRSANRFAAVAVAAIAVVGSSVAPCHALNVADTRSASRRQVLGWVSGAGAALVADPQRAFADPDGMNVDNFLKTGMVAQPMGVSGQAGKSKPETGVVLRDGTDISKDSRTGNVLAELVVKSTADEPMAVVTSFQSRWPLATGAVFDVECRDPDTGDSAFLAVSPDTKGRSMADLKDSFFINSLFSPTGRFSFYGQPTDVKIKKSQVVGDYRVIDVSFSTLSQSTQTEIPRKAQVAVTIPTGSSQAIMLVGSASALRWKKGSDQAVASIISSFRATPAPSGSLRVKAKSDDFKM